MLRDFIIIERFSYYVPTAPQLKFLGELHMGHDLDFLLYATDCMISTEDVAGEITDTVIKGKVKYDFGIYRELHPFPWANGLFKYNFEHVMINYNGPMPDDKIYTSSMGPPVIENYEEEERHRFEIDKDLQKHKNFMRWAVAIKSSLIDKNDVIANIKQSN